MDRITRENRSKNMSKIRSKNTKPELLIRKVLSKKGFRYRLNYKLPGKPDIVFLASKVAIFVNGCFWHGHNCKEGHIPKTNIEFWSKKILNNKSRDKNNIMLLRKKGWKVVLIWECDSEKNVNRKINLLKTYLNEQSK